MIKIEKMKYHAEYRFCSILNDYIDCVWTETYFNQPENKNKPQLIVPDNTIELIFAGSPIERIMGNGKRSQILLSHLSGLKTKPQKIKLSESPLLAVRFKPHGLHRFTEIDVSETIDESINPVDLFGRDIIELEERLFDTPEISQRLHIIESYFMKRLLSRDDYLFEMLLNKLKKLKGNAPVSCLAKEFNVSIKTIERKFLSNLGITPKKYLRLERIIQSLKVKNFEQVDNIAGIAYNNGFFDQMHFTKEVKKFTGLTPKKYFNMDRGVQQPIFS